MHINISLTNYFETWMTLQINILKARLEASGENLTGVEKAYADQIAGLKTEVRCFLFFISISPLFPLY